MITSYYHHVLHISDGPTAGLSVARQIAMLSYRTAGSYIAKFGREIDPVSGNYQVQNYLHYQVSA